MALPERKLGTGGLGSAFGGESAYQPAFGSPPAGGGASPERSQPFGGPASPAGGGSAPTGYAPGSPPPSAPPAAAPGQMPPGMGAAFAVASNATGNAGATPDPGSYTPEPGAGAVNESAGLDALNALMGEHGYTAEQVASDPTTRARVQNQLQTGADAARAALANPGAGTGPSSPILYNGRNVTRSSVEAELAGFEAGLQQLTLLAAPAGSYQEPAGPAGPPQVDLPIDPNLDMTAPGELETAYNENRDAFYEPSEYQGQAQQAGNDMRDLRDPLADLGVDEALADYRDTAGRIGGEFGALGAELRDPRTGEVLGTDAASRLAGGPREGAEYWEGTQGRWGDLSRFDGGSAFNAAFDHNADRLRRDMDKRLAAMGNFGSTQGVGLMGDALAGLRAQQAMKEFDARAETQRLQQSALTGGQNAAFGVDAEGRARDVASGDLGLRSADAAGGRDRLRADVLGEEAGLSKSAFDAVTQTGELKLQEAGFNQGVLRDALSAYKSGNEDELQRLALGLQSASGIDDFNQSRKQFVADYGLELGSLLADLAMKGFGGAFDTDAALMGDEANAATGSTAFGVNAAGRSTDRASQAIGTGLDLGSAALDWYDQQDSGGAPLTGADVQRQNAASRNPAR